MTLEMQTNLCKMVDTISDTTGNRRHYKPISPIPPWYTSYLVNSKLVHRDGKQLTPEVLGLSALFVDRAQSKVHFRYMEMLEVRMRPRHVQRREALLSAVVQHLFHQQ